MRAPLLPVLLLAACKGASTDDSGEDSATPGGRQGDCEGLDRSPPVTVVVLDEAGQERPVERVRWVDPADFDLWENAATAQCAEGEPPCATWVLPADLPFMVLVAADARNEAADPAARPECIGWGATAATLVLGPGQPQRVHLTLPTDALWCDDGATVIQAEGVDRFESLDEGDCLFAPETAPGPLRARVTEPDGAPASAAWMHWYWPPEGPDFDGEHPMACADLGCATWTGDDTPSSGIFYVEAMSWGPPVPDYLTGAAWVGYGAGPLDGAPELAVDVPLEWSILVR